MVSTSAALPMRKPSREFGKDMCRRTHILLPTRNDSQSAASPQAIACAASMTAFSPEPQTVDTAADTLSGQPALITAWRAGIFACFSASGEHLTQKIPRQSLPPATPVSAKSALITVAPNSGAETFAKEPPNFTNRRAFRGDNTASFI